MLKRPSPSTGTLKKRTARSARRSRPARTGGAAPPADPGRGGVWGRERRVAAASSSPGDEARAQFARDILAAIPNFENILYELLDAVGYGVTVAEILWEQEGSRVFIRDLKPRPQELFAFGPLG